MADENGDNALYRAFTACRDKRDFKKQKRGRAAHRVPQVEKYVSDVLLTLGRQAAEAGRQADAAKSFGDIGNRFSDSTARHMLGPSAAEGVERTNLGVPLRARGARVQLTQKKCRRICVWSDRHNFRHSFLVRVTHEREGSAAGARMGARAVASARLRAAKLSGLRDL